MSDKSITFVDAHFHFDLFKDTARILAEIENYQVRTIAVTNAPSVFHYTLKASRSAEYLIPAVGLHPELIATHARELESMWPMLDQTRFVGEVGLDYVYNDLNNKTAQREIFTRIIERCAAYGDKVLSVHSRRSACDVISIIGERYPGRVILHWFSGSRRELEKAIASGFYFSVGPAMVRSKNGLSLLEAMPRKRVLTESDGPFVQTTGRPARPSDVNSVVDSISHVWEIPPVEAKALISANFDHLISPTGSLTKA